ncbi:MAG: hypothetical protein AB7T37_16075 [Dehalococcoidia bacterium]
MRTVLTFGFVAVLSIGLFAACGGDDDDFSDIKGSATAAATSQPTATPTGDSSTGGDTAGYSKSVRDESTVLKKALKKLNDDMIAAQLNQSDPAVPGKLKADVQAVNDSVARLKAMKAPDSLAKFSTDLVAALDQIKKGADGIAKAVDTNDQATGLAAFADLSGGEAKLDAAIATLPA